ncbi:acyl-CoA dehydrogenase family protein [Herbaspirillum sp.]|uniref:acyl-CoA dehydrogenase family protein n=1 Tax=Herbaspirillum sp. TaxID=1890675 RepID=UPI0031D1D040
MSTTANASAHALHQRFSDLFELVGKDAIAREAERRLLFEEVRQLKEAGFSSLRVPLAHGGAGVSLEDYFYLLIRLGEAESNLPQILRVNAGFTEMLLERKDDADTRRWLELIGSGKTFGAATSERNAATGNSVLLERDGNGHLRLNGEKYYSTGTLYADWILVRAHDDVSDFIVLVPADAPGVERVDDWDGFGQRLTGSGTTRFDNVLVDDKQVLDRYHSSQPRRNSILTSFYQTFHLAALAGIARAALRDAVAFTRPRTRTFGVPGNSSPRENPLVHRVVGRLASLAWSAEQLTLAVAREQDALYAARRAGTVTTEDYDALDIRTFEAQQIVLGQVLEATTLLFEVGGASATSATLRLDRHWRNARTLASHNPAIQREAAIGNYHLNGLPHDERFGNGYT